MNLLLDTHALAWLGAGSPKLSRVARDAIEALEANLFVSGIVAFEYADLLYRKRLPGAAPLTRLVRDFELVLLDYPAKASEIAANLPDIHRDPVDRMLIAHGLHLDCPLVTMDSDIHRYQVRIVW
jgi:PIN domain nuclease of toxin-antitoxin system